MRAQVVLLDEERILLARHVRSDGHSYWVLPGGAVEPGETAEQAARREVLEETGLEIRIEKLLYVRAPDPGAPVPIRNERYTFLATISGGTLDASPERIGGNQRNGYLQCASWMPFDSPDYDAATRDTLATVSAKLG
ncbi:MAG: NUDIX domain-containing protein, partial [Chloroflexota bacterium]